MSLPIPFRDQYECRNETLEVYASDRRGLVNYSFNNLGYRNDIDYSEQEFNAGVYVGSSITSGIGIDWQSTFAWTSSRHLEANCYQFSQGCVPVDNQEILRMLSAVKNCNTLIAKYFVIQFIGLNRRYNPDTGSMYIETNSSKNTELFQQIFFEVSTLLKNDNWCFIGSDESNSAIQMEIKKHKHCAAWNFPMIDLAGVTGHPGKRWHHVMSEGIVRKLQEIK